MTIPEQIEEIVGEMCDKYCKFPEQAKREVEDIDEAQEHLWNDYCANCPLNKLT